MRATSLRLAITLASFVSALGACSPPASPSDASADHSDARRIDALDGSDDATVPIDAGPPSAARLLWESRVQPALAEHCAPCHVGDRFAFASLRRAGASFTAAETEANYQTFVDQISIDAPDESRLLVKALGPGAPNGIAHGGGARLTTTDALYTTLHEWIAQERADRCSTCGAASATQYLAYVQMPATAWAFEADPIRADHGLRERAHVMMQRLAPDTMAPTGAPFEFLPASFCGADGRCDFANLAVNHAGTQLAFECRLSLTPADWVNDVRWNVCIADIGSDGHALNARFLLPANHGDTVARSDPFGLLGADGLPLKGHYDKHFRMRRRNDRTPAFSPDDQRVYLSSQRPDPRSGVDGTTTYHGFDHTNNIIAVRTDGTDARTIYDNEGGEADSPFFLRNGNVVFHTWNLERMDRHLYTQATADGMAEIPVFFGHLQGPNMWGRATQLANGLVFGMTGRRRSSIQNYVPFVADHTLGTGIESALPSHRIVDTTVFEQVIDFPDGYCTQPPDGPSCVIDRFYADPSYSPDGRALLAINPERTYVQQGEAMYLGYAQGSTDAERIASLAAYVPQHMGIYRMNARGDRELVLAPPAGAMLRYPVWVGRRAPPRVQPWQAHASQHASNHHIANVPLWFSFRVAPDPGTGNKTAVMSALDRIVALRVLAKEMDGNACLNDDIPYRDSVNAESYDHPTHLGINNASGYSRFVVPASAGGDAYGDVPLHADGSVSVRVPSGRLLLFQGIDADGHVVMQHSRVFTLPPGRTIDTSVRRDQYRSQCSSCHGTVDTQPFVGLTQHDQLPNIPLDYRTEAGAAAPVDLTATGVDARRMTFLHAVRPLLDRACVSCHSGSNPAGELSLEREYSRTANYPAGRWATQPGLASNDYLAFVPTDRRVPGYNYSLSYAWFFRRDESEYRTAAPYAAHIAAHDPMGELAPWDPAYQNLWAQDGARFVYLSGFLNANIGRGDRVGGNAADSYLVEVLTGRDLDPTRNFTGPDHRGFLSANEVRDVIAVIDLGFPFAARCDDRMVPSGPNTGMAWGDPRVR